MPAGRVRGVRAAWFGREGGRGARGACGACEAGFGGEGACGRVRAVAGIPVSGRNVGVPGHLQERAKCRGARPRHPGKPPARVIADLVAAAPSPNGRRRDAALQVPTAPLTGSAAVRAGAPPFSRAGEMPRSPRNRTLVFRPLGQRRDPSTSAPAPRVVHTGGTTHFRRARSAARCGDDRQKPTPVGAAGRLVPRP